MVGHHPATKDCESKKFSVDALALPSAKINDEIEDDEQEIEEEDDDDDHSLIIVDESQPTASRSSSSVQTHLRCRQCSYEAEDLSDLLIHRKSHAASLKRRLSEEKSRQDSSDIENDVNLLSSVEKKIDENFSFFLISGRFINRDSTRRTNVFLR